MTDNETQGMDLNGRDVQADPTMDRVIAMQEKVEAQRRMISALKRDREDALAELTDMRTKRPVPKSPITRRTKEKTEKIRVYAGDLHGMRQDKAAARAFLNDLKVLDPDEVIFGGDMLECGGFLARHQPIGYVAYCDYTLQEDAEGTNWFYDRAQEAAPHATFDVMEGNHDQRIERWIVDQVSANKRDASFLMKLFGPEVLTHIERRGFGYHKRNIVHGEGLTRGWIKRGKMLIVHELRDGENAARNGMMKTAGNVSSFHTHRSDKSSTVYPEHGLVTSFTVGCLCEMQPMWKHTDPSGWNQSYDVDFITKSDAFLRVQVPIWRGRSLAGAMVEKFKS